MSREPVGLGWFPALTGTVLVKLSAEVLPDSGWFYVLSTSGLGERFTPASTSKDVEGAGSGVRSKLILRR